MRNHKQSVQFLALAMAALMLLSLILGLIPKAEAASSSEIKQQINALKDEKAIMQEKINELRSQYDANANEIQDMVNQKNVIDSLNQL